MASQMQSTRKVGRPTAYKPEYAEQAYKLCLLGATDAQMADIFGVAEQTLNNWKSAHREFLESLARGKDAADARVAERLYRRATGYSHDAVKIFMPQGASEPVYAPYTEHYPPDTQAASWWLKNRQPAMWRDRQEHEVTGANGAPLAPAVSVVIGAVAAPEPLPTIEQRKDGIEHGYAKRPRGRPRKNKEIAPR